MAVQYDKLFELMASMNVINGQLQQKAGFSANIITRLKRNQYISLESLEGICRALECSVDDVLEFTTSEQNDSTLTTSTKW